MIIRCFFISVLYVCLSYISFSQDTAYQRIMSAKDDTAKVLALSKYSKSFLRADPEKSRKLNTELIHLSEKLNYPYGIGIGYMDIAYTFAAVAKEEQAIENYNKALSYLRKTANIEMVAKCLLNMGNCIEATGDYSEALKMTFEAIRILENTHYKAMLARAYTSIGFSFYNLDNHAKSIEYLQKAMPLVLEVKDTSRMLMVLYGLSATLSSEDQYKAGIVFADQAIELAIAYGKSDQLHIAHQSMAELLCKQGEGKKAIPHAKLSLRYAKEAGSMHYIIPATMILAEAYGKANNPQQQVAYLMETLKFTEGNDIGLENNLVYKGLSEAYEKMGQFQKALQYHKKYMIARDSVEGSKEKKHIAELELQFQSAQKEKMITSKNLEVARKEVQLQKSKQLTLYSIGATLLAFLMALLMYLHYRSQRKLDQKQLHAVQQEKEIQLLQAVMQGEEKERSRIAKDLHDGVAGMLAAVKMHITSMSSAEKLLQSEEGFGQGLRLLNEATQEIRKTSHNLMPEVLLQHGLDEALRRYCTNVSNNKTLQIQYDSWGEINRFVNSFELSVYRIVQELVNNILKHSKATQAIVQVNQQGNLLSISIEDNGVGLAMTRGGSSDGVGLRSLQRRVQAMNGKIEMQDSEQSGVSAYLEFEVVDLVKGKSVKV